MDFSGIVYISVVCVYQRTVCVLASVRVLASTVERAPHVGVCDTHCGSVSHTHLEYQHTLHDTHRFPLHFLTGPSPGVPWRQS